MASKGTVLVTGGAGYIGAHACKWLARAGYLPVTYDNLSTGWREAVRFGPFEEGDLRDRERLDAAFARHRPVAVMHFAASSLVGESMSDPGRYWHNNLLGALTLAEAARDAGCRDLVLSSTCAVYGEPDGLTLDETAPREPINAYGASKRAIEDLLANFGAAHGLRAVIFRYFNVAGADPEAEIGEDHRPETHLIPLVLDVAAGRREALVIHGTDYDTPDGTCIRDYVHVVDLVEAHVAGLERLLAGLGGGVYNLGTGHGYSVREVARTVEAVTGRKLTVREGPRRPGDAARLVSGSDKARQELGWRPRSSSLSRIVADAWAWHQRGGYGA